jgi:N-acetyl-anhydromuramyl-L-alanine amidase AmpD
MTTFPNLFQATLDSHFANAAASAPKGVSVNKPEYFVVHSTCGTLSENAIQEWKKKGYRGKAHKYVMKDGSVIELWPFSERNVYATKAEKNNPGLKGRMLHIELNYGPGESPTEAQYKSLADLYKEAFDAFGKLVIVPHKEVDRGIQDGHSDPTNFDFDKLYRLINARLSAPLSPSDGISQIRYEVPNQADQINVWPPKLDGKPDRQVDL